MAKSLWNECLDRLESELSSQQFNTWIRPLKATVTGAELRIEAPNQFVLDWISKRFLERITQIIKEISPSSPVTVRLELGGDSKSGDFSPPITRTPEPEPTASPAGTTPRPAAATKTRRQQDLPGPAQLNGLKADYTFETFVEGKSNQLARAAAVQVAQNPGGAYNPLFIYGGVGLGKTHLMHAIGNYIIKQNPAAKAVYLHSERFVQDMVKALQHNEIDKFKRQYRSLNVLLIDDIQFFAGKERSQEEFFHTFNVLLEGQQQVVLTCDRYPKEVEKLEERLSSRFGSGLTIAVEPPELETRVAILLSKAQAAGTPLSDEVAFFIAKRIRSNIRELEGALRRVIANSRFVGKPITVDFAKDALKDLLALQEKLITIENIQKTVADYYKLRLNELLAKKRTRSVARPRQIAMALAKELTNHSLPEIGAAFGGRDHTTVLHACRVIEELRGTDSRLGEDVNNLLRTLTT